MKSVAELEAGVRAGDRVLLAQAITLIESTAHVAQAQDLLTRLLPETGRAMRVGITGVPGAGKSTFIDELGIRLVAKAKKVAVLAVDPSSSITGGSILGDKTRMARLSQELGAYIRPSPSGLTPGGVARRTREVMLLCEAAGFDVVLVETVGVGQGETAVRQMVDVFVVLALPGAGDELQGIKKGVLELADVIAVNKCDGDNAARARIAVGDLNAAMHYLQRKVKAVGVSGLTGEGLDELWTRIEQHRAGIDLNHLRAEQQRAWLWSLIDERLHDRFVTHPVVAKKLSGIEAEVVGFRMTPFAAAEALLTAAAAAR